MALTLESLPGFFAEKLHAFKFDEGPVCIGLSGGLDSVVLLHLARQTLPGQHLFARHVHHGLSPNADEWATFCQRIGREWDIAVHVEYVTLQATGKGQEAAARAARYAALLAPPVNNLMLAHHRGDQAETLLHNLVRGCGVLGAAAMPLRRTTETARILRPLLDVPRSIIRDYALSKKLSWIEDESNDDSRFTRNYLRQQVMPLLAERFPGYEANLSRATVHFSEAQQLLEEMAQEDWLRVSVNDAIPMRQLQTLSLPRLKNLLRYRMLRLGWHQADAKKLHEFAQQLLTAAPDRHPRLTLPDGIMLVAHRQLCFLAPGQTA